MCQAGLVFGWLASGLTENWRLQVSKAALHGNSGLLRFVQQDYSGALAEFEAAAAADPTDAAAINNAAICQLFNTQVGSECRYLTVLHQGAAFGAVSKPAPAAKFGRNCC